METVKLTKAQFRALSLLADHPAGSMRAVYLRTMYQVSGRTMGSLYEQSLVEPTAHPNGPMWRITPAGRTALQQEKA